MRESCDHTCVLTAAVAALVAALLQTPPPHADHAPRLGGQFAVVADDTLHVEGLWAQQRRFVLVVTGVHGETLMPDRLRSFGARVDVAEGRGTPLTLTSDGTLEAQIPSLPLPARITVTMTTDSGDERLPFVFPTYSKATDADMFPLLPTEIPATLPALLSALASDVADARLLVARGDVLFVYAAAVRARDRGLALEAYVAARPQADQARARSSVMDVVRTAWLLHIAADSGTTPQARAAVDALHAAVLDATAVFAEGRR